jgi:hypothetical protein
MPSYYRYDSYRRYDSYWSWSRPRVATLPTELIAEICLTAPFLPLRAGLKAEDVGSHLVAKDPSTWLAPLHIPAFSPDVRFIGLTPSAEEPQYPTTLYDLAEEAWGVEDPSDRAQT